MLNSNIFNLSDVLDSNLVDTKTNNDDTSLSIANSDREKALEEIQKITHTELTPWERVQIARHPERPYTLDYISLAMTNYIEFHGDRQFGDDKAMVGGIACIDNIPVIVMGHQKGRNTKENIIRNFGMPHPEGFRKALRLMQMAEKFKMPIITFIDTPGAYPGVGAEERGQGRAIAYNLFAMSQIKVPIISIVIGEGASGGALAIGLADRILMLENAYYSVISPEGCAAILWKDKTKVQEAAETLKLTAVDLFKNNLIDDIIPEPDKGAHIDYQKTAGNIKQYILKHLHELKKISPNRLLQLRYEHLRQIGNFGENN
ncbi:acetyl-CoA carboxylase carboxyltransferase subunit alpha [Candidatus Poribacteria bacterium]|nr:acetyl-CoA carboxylase carboxyltransferase subunit alpha [Candidatus Poribacteria bacterium]